ncbi:MAG: FxsA family protein [Campylobacterales bacterium]|nr:FxsA family protein [Campylobacterales bacterium]
MPAVLIIIYLFIEVMVTSSFSSAFGGGTLFLEIIGTGILGVVLISSTGAHMNESLMKLRQGQINPQDLMGSTISRIVGGVLLFLPGITTDIMGLILQLGFKKFGKNPDNNAGFRQEDKYTEYNDNDDIIDVEVIDRKDK